MAILTIENDIITQLQSSITDLKIECYPENPAEYKLLHPKGAVLVRFQGASYSKPTETVFIQQDVSLEFNITLMVKGLRDKNGAYNYIDSIISALTGHNGMYPTKVAFLTEEAGIWRYSIIFTVPTENYS
jgi:hypothetical protein